MSPFIMDHVKECESQATEEPKLMDVSRSIQARSSAYWAPTVPVRPPAFG